jgi:solute carrier family 35 protein F1/2
LYELYLIAMAPTKSEPQLEVALDKGNDMGPVQSSSVPVSAIQPKDVSARSESSGNGRKDGSEAVEYVGGDGVAQGAGDEVSREEGDEGDLGMRKGTWFAYLRTKQFWVVLVLGQGKLHEPRSLLFKSTRTLSLTATQS